MSDMSDTETPNSAETERDAVSPAADGAALAAGDLPANPEHASPADASPADASPADASPADASPADASPADASPADGAAPAPSGWWSLRFPPSPRMLRLVATVGTIVVLLGLLPALLNGSHDPANATSARSTATPQPPTPIPSPTAMPGYQPLVDNADGFIIQYPLAWSCASSNPGVDCIDSPNAQTYRLQVQLPSAWTGADTSADPNSGASWVDYALSAFTNVPGRSYTRIPGPSQPTIFGGATWQSGAAIIGIEPSNSSGGSGDQSATPTSQAVRIRVQVYATVHDTKPYIIALYAADDQFATGSDLYFQPMLRSFAFLPDGNEQ